MPDDALAFVQFIHPGGEHAPDRGNLRTWNLGMHRRKFMLAKGDYLYEGNLRHGRIAFWGEWEPPSRVIEAYPAQDHLPRFLHEPLLTQPHLGDFPIPRDTDPFVFGDRFHYADCQQRTNKGRSETQLRRLLPGSVILFGSCLDSARFVIDTVFVVAQFVEHSSVEPARQVDETYRTMSLDCLYADSKHRSFRLYSGATPDNTIGG